MTLISSVALAWDPRSTCDSQSYSNTWSIGKFNMIRLIIVNLDSSTIYGGSPRDSSGIQMLSFGTFILTNNTFIQFPTNKVAYRPVAYKIAPNICLGNSTKQ
jgi:hypothetical protein